MTRGTMIDKMLTIGIPTYGQVDPSFAVQLRLLQVPFKTFQVLNPQNMQIDEARNFIVDKMQGDYLFFLDSDVIPPIDAITRLVEHKKDIVCGLYFQKQSPFFPVIFNKSEAGGRYDVKMWYEKNKLIEVYSAGLGCCLIKREVFEKIGAPWFKFTTGWGEVMRESEDHYFFRRAREKGYKIYCDTLITCGHMGKEMMTEPMWEMMREEAFPKNKPITN